MAIRMGISCEFHEIFLISHISLYLFQDFEQQKKKKHERNKEDYDCHSFDTVAVS